MGTKTLYQCDEPGCTNEAGTEEKPILGWTSVPEAWVIGGTLARHHLFLCPEHRPTWVGEGDSGMDATLASMKERTK